ncbi:MAG: fused MFS/spermidine synthase [Pseudomonadota bacterium]
MPHSVVCSVAAFVATAFVPTAFVALGLPVVANAQSPAPPGGAACGVENLITGKVPWQQTPLRGAAALITDGAAGPEGALWDAPVAARLEAGGSVTYDLGQLRSITALVLQADANDTYRVSGSADGAPGTFKFIAEIANVVDRGPGLRTRSIQVLPTALRYLRVGEAEGDGFYSISEFAAYCKAPTPFPPAMRTVDAPLAQPAAAPDRTKTKSPPLRDNSGGRFGLVVAALALALAGAAGFLRKRGAAADQAGGDASRLTGTAADDDSPSPLAPLPVAAESTGASTHDLLRLLFLASGCAALIYEVVWFHLLRLVIGASALSVGIVLASFMGGMFLGSLLFARFIPRGKNALRVYAGLEIGIGVFGLLMPLVLPAVRFIYVGLVGYGSLGIALRAVIAAVLLLPPTALMGATLPAVARRYAHGRRGMSGLASLYAANTTGAVIGCLLSGFYLLAVWDVWVATFTAVAINLAVGVFALRLARRSGAEVTAAADTLPAPLRPVGARLLEARAVYLAVGLSGLTALGAQVVWTRLLTLLFGATVYAFAIILAVFLAGLGIGSAVAAYLLRRGQNATRGLAWTQVALVPAIMTAAYLLADVLPFASPPASTPISALHALHVLRAIAVVLPGAALWGMSFPFALAAASSSGGDTGRSSGHVYAANTGGAILGALLVSFWAIPTLGTRWAQQSLVVAAAVSGAALFFAMSRGSTAAPSPAGSVAALRLGGGGRSLSPSWALAAGFLAAAFLPGASTVFLAHGRYIWWVDPRDEYPFVSEGAASTVAVHVAPDGYRNFHVSGRVEATNNPNDMRMERMLGHLSALAHPKPESVLVVGLGAGITAGALAQHPEIKRVVICEIEPRVTGAASLFAAENYSVLTDPKVQIVFDDARHFLATTREKFDIITSDPIHPWVRGNSVLFSREYYAVVRSKLKPGGIATQWVPLYETSEEAIQIQMKTFMDAFADGTIWNSASNGKGYDVVLLGRAEPLRMDLLEIQARIDRTPAIGQSLRDVKMGSAVDLLATYGASAHDMRSWYAKTPLNRDFSLKLEYISGLALNAKEADEIYEHMVAARTYPSGAFIAPPNLEAELRRRILGAANKR